MNLKEYYNLIKKEFPVSDENINNLYKYFVLISEDKLKVDEFLFVSKISLKKYLDIFINIEGKKILIIVTI